MKFFNLLLLSGLVIGLVGCNTKRNPFFGDEDAQFYAESMDAQTETIDKQGDGLSSSVKLVFTSCLKTLAGGAMPQDQEFTVKSPKSSIAVKTNKFGCLVWNEFHNFDPNETEKYLRLKRTLVSRSEFSGTRSYEVYWNPSTEKFQNNLKNNEVPLNTEDPLTDDFHTQNISATHQSLERAAAGNGDSETKLFLPAITLARVKLNQFKVDQHLNLYAQHRYVAIASPKLFVKQIGKVDKVVSPPLGTYKITLVFMDDPMIDLEKMGRELNGLNTLEEVQTSVSPEMAKVKVAADYLKLQAGTVLNKEMKSQLIASTLLPYVHSTKQFVADKTLENDGINESIDMFINRFAKLDVRSILAVTVENISAGQKRLLKGHGANYVNSLLEPGNVSLRVTALEADRLFASYSEIENRNEEVYPLDLFIQSSLVKNNDKAHAFLDKNSLPQSQLAQGVFPGNYPFAEQLEAYLHNEIKNPFNIKLLMRALCNKAFMNDELKVLEKQNGKYPDEARLTWAFKCHSGIQDYMDVQVLDFVVNSKNAVVKKVGETIPENISISRSFDKSQSTGISQGSGMEAGVSKDLTQYLNLAFDGKPVPEEVTKLLKKGKPLNLTQFANYLVPGIISVVSEISPLAGSALSFLRTQFPISIGENWTYSSTSSLSTGQSGKVSKSSERSLTIDTDTFKITDLETRRCIKIDYNNWVVKYFADHYNVNLRKGYIACAEKTMKPIYTEKYYTVTQACSENKGKSDCASTQETYLRMMMRGEGTYKQFSDMILNTDLNILLNPMATDSLDQKRMEWSKLMDSLLMAQVFPGVLPPPK